MSDYDSIGEGIGALLKLLIGLAIAQIPFTFYGLWCAGAWIGSWCQKHIH